jgi:hypothetical protein
MAMDTKKLQQINVDTYSPVLTQHELNGTRQGRSNIEPGIQKLEANGTPTYVVCIKDVLIGINEAHVVYFG